MTAKTIAAKKASALERLTARQGRALTETIEIDTKLVRDRARFATVLARERGAVTTEEQAAAVVREIGEQADQEGGERPTVMADGGERHAPGCDDERCEGLNADADRPELSFPCWEVWSAESHDWSEEVAADTLQRVVSREICAEHDVAFDADGMCRRYEIERNRKLHRRDMSGERHGPAVVVHERGEP